ncbi:MAG: hypothetical protein QGI45_05215 [Myxococcota bacterium]|nr:hypothetical protein [Myxococcota bacterium]
MIQVMKPARILKALLFLGALVSSVALFSGSAKADTYVRGYFRSNGTYVQPHYRSDRDGNFYNNWTTYPNVNPYTGKRGTRRTPDSDFLGYGSSYNYYSGW